MPVEGIPNGLKILMTAAFSQMDTKSWQIYNEQGGVCIKIRLRNRDHDSENQTGDIQIKTGSYTKKSTSQTKRDLKRSVEHSKQFKMTTRSESAKMPEISRAVDSISPTSKIDISPISIQSDNQNCATPNSYTSNIENSIAIDQELGHAYTRNQLDSVSDCETECDNVVINNQQSPLPLPVHTAIHVNSTVSDDFIQASDCESHASDSSYDEPPDYPYGQVCIHTDCCYGSAFCPDSSKEGLFVCTKCRPCKLYLCTPCYEAGGHKHHRKYLKLVLPT